MAIWKLYPQFKNNVEEVQVWFRGDAKISRKENFSFAVFECENETRPDIDLVNAQGIELTQGTEYNWDLTDLQRRDGGPWVSWSFSDNMTQGDRDELIYMIDSGSYIALNIAGWERESIEYWFRGPLVLEEMSR